MIEYVEATMRGSVCHVVRSLNESVKAPGFTFDAKPWTAFARALTDENLCYIIKVGLKI